MFRLPDSLRNLPKIAKRVAEEARQALNALSAKFARENLADKETSEAQRELAKERARRAAR